MRKWTEYYKGQPIAIIEKEVMFGTVLRKKHSSTSTYTCMRIFITNIRLLRDVGSASIRQRIAAKIFSNMGYLFLLHDNLEMANPLYVKTLKLIAGIAGTKVPEWVVVIEQAALQADCNVV